MATERKLGRTASQRKAMLRGLTTQLLWFGRIETTVSRAKEVRSIADKMITLAAREYDKSVEVEKETILNLTNCHHPLFPYFSSSFLKMFI